MDRGQRVNKIEFTVTEWNQSFPSTLRMEVTELETVLKTFESALSQIKWRLKLSSKRRLEIGYSFYHSLLLLLQLYIGKKVKDYFLYGSVPTESWFIFWVLCHIYSFTGWMRFRWTYLPTRLKKFQKKKRFWLMAFEFFSFCQKEKCNSESCIYVIALSPIFIDNYMQSYSSCYCSNTPDQVGTFK